MREVESTEDLEARGAGQTAETIDIVGHPQPQRGHPVLPPLRPTPEQAPAKLQSDNLVHPSDFFLKLVQTANQACEEFAVHGEGGIAVTFKGWRGGGLGELREKFTTPSGLKDDASGCMVTALHSLLHTQTVILEHSSSTPGVAHRVKLLEQEGEVAWPAPHQVNREDASPSTYLKVLLPECPVDIYELAGLCRQRCPWSSIPISFDGDLFPKLDAQHIGRVFAPVSPKSLTTEPHWVLLSESDAGQTAKVCVQKHGVILNESPASEYQGWTLHVCADDFETDASGLKFQESARLQELRKTAKDRLGQHFGSPESRRKPKDVWSYEPSTLMLLCLLGLGACAHLLMACLLNSQYTEHLVDALGMVGLAALVEVGMSLRIRRKVRPLARPMRLVMRTLAILWAGAYLALGPPAGSSPQLFFPAWGALVLDFILNPDPPWD